MTIWKWIRLRFGQGSSSRWIRVRDYEAEAQAEDPEDE